MANCRACKHYILDGATRCPHCGTYQKWISQRWLTILGILVTFAMAAFIGVQSKILNTQTNTIKRQTDNIEQQTNIIKRSFEIENRPYLYLDITPLAFSNREKQLDSNEEYDNLYVGAELTYKNVGKLPACNIKSEIHFYSDVDQGDNFERLKKWYMDVFGYFPEPTTVFPHQEGQKIVCKPDCSDSTKDYLFTVRISYTGKDPNKVYWYATDVRYSIEKGSYKQKVEFVRQGDKIIQVPGIKEYSIYLINVTSDYDRDGRIMIPPALTREDLFKKSVP